MLEPDLLAQSAAELFAYQALTGKHVLITAGPRAKTLIQSVTLPITALGKWAFILLKQPLKQAHKSTSSAGPVHLATPDRVQRVDVNSARDMLAACEAAMPCDILIAAAAVARLPPRARALNTS